jgi:hypothetical protein
MTQFNHQIFHNVLFAQMARPSWFVFVRVGYKPLTSRPAGM